MPTMSNQDWDAFRAKLREQLNAREAERAELEGLYGKVWDTEELKADFEGFAFEAPFVGVTRKSDKQPGHLTFQDRPRFYFEFTKSSDE